MDDLELDELVRNTVIRIADGAPQPHPFPASSNAVDRGGGLGRPIRWMEGHSRLALVAVATTVAMTGGWLASSAGLFDRSIDVEATDEGVVASSASGANTGVDQAWPTVTPGAELIPSDALAPRRLIFGPGDEPTDVVEDYLTDRLPDLAAIPDGLVIEEIETVDGHAVFGWLSDVADVRVNGWIYLLEADGSWWVVAAVTEGVDAHRVVYDLERVVALITSTGDEPLVMDLVDIDTGEPFEPVSGETPAAAPSERRLGVAGRSERLGDVETIEIDTPVGRQRFAVRIQAVGGTPLTITEFTVSQENAEMALTLFVEPAAVDTVAAALEADIRTADYQLRDAADTQDDYRRLFSDASAVTEIWDEAAGLESISLALATNDPTAVVIEELGQLDGVLAVVATPSPSSSEHEEAAAREYAECPVTQPPREAFVPPEPWPATPALDGLAWYGTDDLWTVIEIGGSVENKSVWWSAKFPGGTDEPNPPLTVTFERLDTGAAPIVYDAPGTNGFTDADQWFMINGLEPREAGCWRATATYKGTALSYIYEAP
ncbi:MAG: hypothetical protein AAGD35_00550 [Actinomycetota bacterium]